ncbi:MAG: hypothetical protein MJ108_05875 [Saccharofermentans sp.]|nr:hypothetical protein [Saccharofermentans sp.]
MSDTTRTQKAAKNYMFFILGNITVYVTTFIMQTLFIYYLGTEYNGVKGLFSSILGTLSLAELGIGTAISFSLYSPLANGDKKKIQALIKFYKTAYRYVALVVGLIGIALIPFLRFIINGGENIKHITVIYLLYLADTVLSYLVIYKSTILEADQKAYIMTNIYSVSNIVILIVQSLVIVLFKNFILYLVVQVILGFISKLIVNYSVNKYYPYLKEKDGPTLSEEEKKTIFTKIKALVVHKVGVVTITQTDNIIMSAFINITTVGICANFTMIIKIIDSLVTGFFVASAPGLGNVVATESDEKKLEIFKLYDFLGFILFGWSAICLYFLLIPFVTVWIGGDKLIDSLSVFLLCLNYYLTGQRISPTNMKVAAGIVEQDAPLSIVESIVNIVVSIVCVRYFGLPGIFVGTFISGLIQDIGKPVVLYKYLFRRSSNKYFVRYVLRIVALALACLVIASVKHFIVISNLIAALAVDFLLCAVIPLLVFAVLYSRSHEWKYCVSVVKKTLRLQK